MIQKSVLLNQLKLIYNNINEFYTEYRINKKVNLKMAQLE